MKKITQEDVDKAWEKARDKAREAWDKAREARGIRDARDKARKDWEKARNEAWELQRKFGEQEDLE